MKMVSPKKEQDYTFSFPSAAVTVGSDETIFALFHHSCAENISLIERKSERSDLYLLLHKRQKGYQGELPDKRMMYGQVRTNSVLATIVISARNRDSENKHTENKK